MKYEYEVHYTTKDGDQALDFIAVEDWEELEQYAESVGATLICGLGPDWDDYKKCWFCNEWTPIGRDDGDPLCEQCESYLISRGEI